MSESNNLFWLKLLVYVMGVVLALGGISMMYLAYYQISAGSATSASQQAESPEMQAHIKRCMERVACKDSTVDLTKRGTIITTSVGTDKLTRVVILKTSGEYEVVSVDGCTGEITHTLTLPVSMGGMPSPAESPTLP